MYFKHKCMVIVPLYDEQINLSFINTGFLTSTGSRSHFRPEKNPAPTSRVLLFEKYFSLKYFVNSRKKLSDKFVAR